MSGLVGLVDVLELDIVNDPERRVSAGGAEFEQFARRGSCRISVCCFSSKDQNGPNGPTVRTKC